MLKHNTIIAGIALISVSACSVSPIQINPESPLAGATEKLSDASGKLWTKTKHVLRLDGTGKDALPRTDNFESDVQVADLDDEALDLDEFKDEVDLALVQDEVPINDGGDIVVAATIDSGDALELDIEEPIVIAEATGDELAPEAQSSEKFMGDVEHVVRENETLWILAKQLTGDATNWRILAELNGLDENGSVFPGQKLHIPADLVTVGEMPTLAAATSSEPDTKRLEIPTVADASAANTDAVDTVTEIVIADVTAADKAPQVPTLDVPTTDFEVQAGETMWDLAKRTTGDATNWKSIAAANGMNDQDAAFIKYGQKVGVPTDLLKSGDDLSTVAAAPITTTVVEEAVEEAPAVAAATATVAAAADTATPASSDGNVKIVPANFTANPPVLTEALPAASATTETAEQSITVEEGNGDWVMVSGTYYPKAIYNDANFSAPLLMRVSPGTKLQVARAVGPWFEVKTEKGVGFVHSRDIK